MSDQETKVEQKSTPVEKKWVQFDESSEPPLSQNHETQQDAAGNQYNGAVIDTQSVQVDIDKVKQITQSATNEPINSQRSTSGNLNSVLRTINLDETYSSGLTSVIDPSYQRRFGKTSQWFQRLFCILIVILFLFHEANGDVIVSVLPVNKKWPWIVPAEFRPELVPEELMAEGLSVMKN